MNYNAEDLKHYEILDAQLIPLNIWNKKIKGKERGKTPLDMEWTLKEYRPDQYSKWVSSGLNIGMRIDQRQLVVDLDPRNYIKGVDTPGMVADMFGYDDFEDLLWENCVVRTGSGGYHIYYYLPESVDPKQLRTVLDDLPGVDFKRKGGYVVAAGSKHPNGEKYTWETKETPRTLTVDQLKPLLREDVERDYSAGYGLLNGTQLQEAILDKLDVDNYSSNDTWFPIMCACHHVTAGDGIEEFLEWSLNGEGFYDEELTIRSRWDSIANDKGRMNTAGTLIQELDKSGEDSGAVRSMLTFAKSDALTVDDEDSEEAAVIRESKRIADSIDYTHLFKMSVPEGTEIEGENYSVDGAAMGAVENLPSVPHDDDISKCLRLIKSANAYEGVRALELLAKKSKISKGTLNKLLKEMDEKLVDDLGVVVCEKTLEITFNGGEHLTAPPSGILYWYRKTHWVELSENFLGKIVQVTIRKLREKVDIKANELSLIQQAVKLCSHKAATLRDKLHSTGLPRPIINCRNGELWLGEDGTHKLMPHNPKSYLLNCLDVEYDPSAECPLFMQTLNEIFSRYDDTEDMVRHMAEIMGYAAQPYKNIASWWLFRGPGGDGKSTILKILDAVLGDAQLATTTKILLAANSEGGSDHAFTALVGKLCLTIEELPAGYLLKDAALKLLSENTKMSANPKHMKEFDFMYSATLIMCSNGFPTTRDLSQGMMRRANVIPFNMQFHNTGKEDLDRAKRITSDPNEMSGVLNFMLAGLERLRDRGRFKTPKSCEEARMAWMSEANNTIRFVEEKIKKGLRSEVVGEFQSVYDFSYLPWCQYNDIDEKVRKRKSQFKRDLISLGFTVEAGEANRMTVYGGSLVEDLEEDF